MHFSASENTEKEREREREREKKKLKFRGEEIVFFFNPEKLGEIKRKISDRINQFYLFIYIHL